MVDYYIIQDDLMRKVIVTAGIFEIKPEDANRSTFASSNIYSHLLNW